MTTKEKDYLTTRDAAKLLNVAVSTIQLWSDNGSLSAWTTAGGHRRIEKSSVERMLNKHQKIKSKHTHGQPMSIVVVDDNKQDLMLYKQYFANWGINANVCLAKDGYAGLINIGKTLPNIIITDLMMPDLNGFEMIKAIKEISELEKCYIIVMSALTEDEIRIRGGLPSDVMVFNKSQSFNELEPLIRTQVNSYYA